VSVTVDHELLAAGELGLHTVGQVLTHLQDGNRLVVQVLIDGQEPDPGQIRERPLAGHSIFIETADPLRLALDVIQEARQQLQLAEQFKLQAADLLQQGHTPPALQQLNGCLRAWQDAQDTIHKTAELMRVDLDAVMVAGRPLRQVLEGFAGQLREIRCALERRDFVSLGDVLLYETSHTTADWLACMEALGAAIEGRRGG
jgi:hypothetical protein